MNQNTTNIKTPISKSTKIYSFLCIGGLIFPPLLIVGGVGLLFKGVMYTFAKIKKMWINRGPKVIDCFNDNFNLSKKGVINKESQDFLKNTFTQYQAEKNKLIFEFKNSFPKNNLIVYSFDKSKNDFIKEKLIGKVNGKWIIKNVQIDSSETNRLNYLYQDQLQRIKMESNKDVEKSNFKLNQTEDSEIRLLEYCKPDKCYKTCSEINKEAVNLQKLENSTDEGRTQKC